MDMHPTPAAASAALIPELRSQGWKVGRNFFAPIPRLASADVLAKHELAETLITYRAALAETTDAEWRYRMAEGSDYSDGARHFARLSTMQVIVDPKGELWMEFMPTGFDIPLPRVRSNA
jgi:hypothetical protein